MRLDERARLAVDDIQLAVDRLDTEARGPLERFDRYCERRRRAKRLTAGALATIVAISALVVVLRELQPNTTPASGTLPPGTILYGNWHPKTQNASWFTVTTDGSDRTDLGIVATCATWFPSGDRILITNDAAFRRSGGPLRPATVLPDGSGLVPLDGLTDPGLNLGCGDVSPDESRVAVEGWVNNAPSRSGIYEVSATDGSGLVRLTHGRDSVPVFSPDGRQVAFFRTKTGITPDGAGAVFVVNTDGTGLRRLTPLGWAFLFEAWSPDGRWIAFQKPYGQLYLVHPDGSDLHQVPLALPPGMGAADPSWSPDGQWLTFTAQNGDTSTLWAAHPDGSGLQQITTASGAQETSSKWRP
jgi:dipeptidyl aminopeptidase/acylaminoacyl peptidase